MAAETNALRCLPVACRDIRLRVLPPRVALVPALLRGGRVVELSADTGGRRRGSDVAWRCVRRSSIGAVVHVDAALQRIAELSVPVARPPATDRRGYLGAFRGRFRYATHRRFGIMVAARPVRSRRAEETLPLQVAMPSRLGSLASRDIVATAAAGSLEPDLWSFCIEVRCPVASDRGEG